MKQEYVKYTCEQCSEEVVIDDTNRAEADSQMYNWHTLYRRTGDKKHFCSFKCLGEWAEEDKG